MQTKKIPHTISGYLNPLMLDYIHRVDTTKQFYSVDFSMENILESAKPENFTHINRKQLVKCLTLQNYNLQISEKTQQNIASLESENSFCIVTAHQLNIFTGPLYIIYKTVSIIMACVKLKKQEPEKDFIPVFVLGSEDHDLNEINHFNLFNKTFTWSGSGQGACGRLNSNGFESIIGELNEIFNANTLVQKLLEVFQFAYEGKNSLSQATRIILNHLFGKYGLVIIDSDDALLKEMTKDLIKEELLHKSSFKLVEETDALLKKNYKEQAHAREINLFYLEDGLRERIIWNKATSMFQVLNTKLEFDEESIIQLVETSTDKFSPNVILRPVFQQAILPALAYVGGGGELSYWLQLKSTFQQHRIPFPALLLRNSFLLIESNNNKKIGKLNVPLEDFFKEEDILIKNYIVAHSDGDIRINEEKSAIQTVFNNLSEKVKIIDSTLEKSVQAELQNTLNALDRLEGKLIKSRKQKSETEINQLRTIRQKLFPNGVPQERFDNLLAWYSRYGDNFLQLLIDNADPFNPELTVLFED